MGDNDMALERAEKRSWATSPEDAELKFYHALALARTRNDDAIDAFGKVAKQFPSVRVAQ
jgi:hypothetical protein